MNELQIISELEADSLEVDSLLESLSLGLMKDNITEQILGVSESSTDFLGVVLDKFNTILSEDIIEETDKSEIKSQMIDVCQDLLITISDEMNIGVNTISEDYESCIDLLDTLYAFFVLDRYSYVESFFIEYIRTNKTPLLDSIDKDDEGKDITSMSYKKKNANPEDVMIQACVNEIMSFIAKSGTVDPEEFLDTIDDGGTVVANMIEYYGDGTISGNFVPSLLNSVIGGPYDSDDSARIRNSIRTAFS